MSSSAGEAFAVFDGYSVVTSFEDVYLGVVEIYADGSATYTYGETEYNGTTAPTIDGVSEADLKAHINSLLGTWTAVTSEDDLAGTTTGGNYYLAEDIETTSTVTIGDNSETVTTVNLALNGKTIEYKGGSTASVITVLNYNVLNLYGNGETIGYGYWSDSDAYEIVAEQPTSTNDYNEIIGGLITGGNTTSGGGVVVYGNATFNMYGGTIAGNTADSGAGVKVGSEFNMYGGVICGNYAEYSSNGYGGGVYIDQNKTGMTMSGGVIANNKADDGGAGVYTGSNFTMTGGTISGNIANGEGGGVYLNYANIKFEMSGGTITGNTAGDGGGGVYVNTNANDSVDDFVDTTLTNVNGIFTMSGGSITANTATTSGGGVALTTAGTFYVSGSPVISGNVVNDGENDKYANNVNVASGNTIKIVGKIEGTDVTPYIGVSGMSYGDTVAEFGDGYGGASSDAGYFKLDDSESDYVIKYNTTNLVVGYDTPVVVFENSIYAYGEEILIVYGGLTENNDSDNQNDVDFVPTVLSKVYFGYIGTDNDYTDPANYQYFYTQDNDGDFVVTKAEDDVEATALDIAGNVIYGGGLGDTYTGDTRVTITGGAIDGAFSGNGDYQGQGGGSTGGTQNLDISLQADLTLGGSGLGTAEDGITSFETVKTVGEDDEDACYVINYFGDAKAIVAYVEEGVSLRATDFVSVGTEKDGDSYDIDDYSYIKVDAVEAQDAVEADDTAGTPAQDAVSAQNACFVFAIDLSKVVITVEDTNSSNSTTYDGNTVTSSDVEVKSVVWVVGSLDDDENEENDDIDLKSTDYEITESWVDSNGGTTIQNAGSYTKTLTADTQTPGEFFGTATATYTVSEATVTVAWSDGSYTYTGSGLTAPTATYTDVGGSSVDLVVAEDDGKTFQNAGGYSFSASFAGDDTDSANYTLNGDTKAVTVAKATNAFTATPTLSGWTYGDSANSVANTTATFGTATISYSGTTKAGVAYSSTDVPTQAGSYTATVSVAGTDNYSELSETINFTIAQRSLELSAVSISSISAKTYSGSEIKPEVTVSDSGATIATSDYGVSYSANTDVGTSATVTITATETGNYTASASVTFTITAKEVDVVWTVGTYTYTGSEITTGLPTASYVNVGGTSVDLDVAIATGETFTNVGSYTFTASLDADDSDIANYVLKTVADSGDNASSVTVEIESAENEISDLAIASWVYGNYDSVVNAPSATATFGTEISYTYSDDENGEFEETVPTAVGTYFVKAVVESADDYAGAEQVISFTISRGTVSFAVTGNSVNVTDVASFVGVTVSAVNGTGGTVEASDYTITYKDSNGDVVAVGDISAVGSYSVWAEITNANYRHLNSTSGTAIQVGVLTVYSTAPKTYTVTFVDNLGENATSESTGLISGDKVLLSALADCTAEQKDYQFAGWSYGGGVYVYSEVEGVSSLILSGAPYISGNTGSNVYLYDDTVIEVAGSLSGTVGISVPMIGDDSADSVVVATGSEDYTISEDDAKAFSLDNAYDYSLAFDDDGNLVCEITKTYILGMTVPTFDSVTEGYGDVSAGAIALINYGTATATVSEITISNTDAFVLDDGNCTITPKTELSEGTYTAVVTVVYNDGATISKAVSFVVAPASTYLVTVVNGSGSGYYVEGAEVTLESLEIVGKTFKEWTVTGGTMDGDVLTVGTSACTVTAVYEDIISDVEISVVDLDGNAVSGAVVKIDAITSTETSTAGTYGFTGITYGIHTVSVTPSGGEATTSDIFVSADGAWTVVVNISTSSATKETEVVSGEDITVAVGGMESLLSSEEVDEKITVSVETVQDETNADIAKIENMIEDAESEATSYVVAITVEKTTSTTTDGEVVSETKETLSVLDDYLTIVFEVPDSMLGKDIALYTVHEGVAKQLGQLKDGAEPYAGTFAYDGRFVTLYLSEFSTFVFTEGVTYYAEDNTAGSSVGNITISSQYTVAGLSDSAGDVETEEDVTGDVDADVDVDVDAEAEKEEVIVVPTVTPTTEADGGSSFPWWILIAVAIIGGVVGFVVWKKKK